MIRRNFPLDGEYVIKVQVPSRPADPHQLEISVDGERVQLISIGGQGAAPQGAAGQTPGQAGQGRGISAEAAEGEAARLQKAPQRARRNKLASRVRVVSAAVVRLPIRRSNFEWP